MTRTRFRLLATGLTAAAAAALVFPALAQDASGTTPPPTTPAVAQAAPTINYKVALPYPSDPQRLKRRPVLDGMIGENEWDAFYTVGDGPVKGTVFVNWDDDFLYVAARTDQPAWFVFNLDANGDGWLHGADNLELTVAPLAAAPAGGAAPAPATVTARILDAASSKDSPVWNTKVVDPRSIQVVEKASGTGQVIEMAIPKGIAGLNLRSGASLGCRGDFAPPGPAPASTEAYEPHRLLEAQLVEARVVAAPGITPRLSLDDTKLIPGQTLRATLDLLSQSEEETPIRSITWQGDAAAADLIALYREVNVPPVKGQKALRRRFSSVLPATAVPGFYQMTVTAQLENGRTVSATTSFSVVEPFSLKIAAEPDPIMVNGPTNVKMVVEVYSAAPSWSRADLQIDLPTGWDAKGRQKKDILTGREDATTRTAFGVTLPSTTPAGDYTVGATIFWHGKTWKTSRTVHVNRAPDQPSAPP